MGHGITVNCGDCRYSREFSLGTGMAFARLTDVLDCLHDNHRQTVSDLIENHRITDSDYDYKLFQCPECHHLTARFYAIVTYDNGNVYETVFTCRKCGTVLKEIEEENISELPCPLCHGLTLGTRTTMLWD